MNRAAAAALLGLLVGLLLGAALMWVWRGDGGPVEETDAAAGWVPSDELCIAAARRTGEPEYQAYQAYLDAYHPEGDGPKYDAWIGLTVPQACAERAAMNWDWIKTWSPLGLGIVLLGVAAIALEREQTDGAGALAGVGFLMIGVWLTVVLHDRWHDDDGEG